MSRRQPPGQRRSLRITVLIAALASTALGFVALGAQAATPAETTAANSVLSLLNEERAANSLPRLGSSTALISSARRHNLTMAGANQLSHQLPGEAAFSTRISQAGVAWHSAAENIGWTTDRTTNGARGLELSMYNEVAPNDGHRQNILSRSVRYVGIDVYIDARTGKLWLTEDFADVAGPSAVAAVVVPPPAACALLSGGKYATYPSVATSRAGGAVYVNALVKQNCSGGLIRSSARTVYVQRNLASGWQTIAIRTTGADGAFTLGFMSTANLQYRLVVPASATAVAAVSAATPAPSGAVPVNGKYLSYVYISPQRQGQAVYVNALVKQGWPTGIVRSYGRTVFVQRLLGGQWQNMLSRYTDRSGTFSVGFMAAPGYRYRLVALPSPSAWGGRTA